jgi:hypothetical protein
MIIARAVLMAYDLPVPRSARMLQLVSSLFASFQS